MNVCEARKLSRKNRSKPINYKMAAKGFIEHGVEIVKLHAKYGCFGATILCSGNINIGKHVRQYFKDQGFTVSDIEIDTETFQGSPTIMIGWKCI